MQSKSTDFSKLNENMQIPNIYEVLTSNSLQKFIFFVCRSGELVAYIAGMPSSAEVVRAMDEISDTVCDWNFKIFTVLLLCS